MYLPYYWQIAFVQQAVRSLPAPIEAQIENSSASDVRHYRSQRRIRLAVGLWPPNAPAQKRKPHTKGSQSL